MSFEAKYPGTGYLKPGPDGLVWLTDLQPPAPRLALGLTSFSLDCDRMARVFEVQRSSEVVWWMDYRRTHRWLIAKESCDGVMPMHWFVSEVPLPAVELANA